MVAALDPDGFALAAGDEEPLGSALGGELTIAYKMKTYVLFASIVSVISGFANPTAMSVIVGVGRGVGDGEAVRDAEGFGEGVGLGVGVGVWVGVADGVGVGAAVATAIRSAIASLNFFDLSFGSKKPKPMSHLSPSEPITVSGTPKTNCGR